jgi:DNA polymerase-3 subunit alpha
MINLIKSGAFDGFGDRIEVMHQYIDSVSDTKKRITLQNMKMLIDFGLIPDDYDMERRVYNFNKYIKKMKLDGTYYGLDNIGYEFYTKHFDIDKLDVCDDTESGFKIKQVSWDNIYQRHMDNIRPWVQKNAASLLKEVNDRLTRDMWNKYCLGTISKWEMDSISCYIHEHELINVDNYLYDFEDYNSMSEEPVVERVVPIKGKLIPIFKLFRIAGTVLDRDKAKKIVTLLTTSGVVTVKVYGGVFQVYDKQISERGADGKKHVLEKSTFTRGNKIIVTGIREGDTFLAKVYKNTPHHRIELIDQILEDGTIITRVRNGEE